METPDSRRVKSYVLRAGRMTPSQKAAYENLFPRFSVNYSGEILDFEAVFGNKNPVIVEIGFGMGGATVIIAERNPEINYLGIEVFRPGIGALLRETERRGLENIRVLEHDAAEVFETMIPAFSLAGIHLFFPDPWPKKRHRKRRLVRQPFTGLLAGKLREGGYLYLATDWEDYAREALEELSATPGLRNPFTAAGGDDGFAPRQEWRPETKFERKGTEKDHAIRELYFTGAGPTP